MNIRKTFGQAATILVIAIIIWGAFALMTTNPDDLKAGAVEAKNSLWEEIKSFFTSGFTDWSNQFEAGRQQALPAPTPTP